MMSGHLRGSSLRTVFSLLGLVLVLAGGVVEISAETLKLNLLSNPGAETDLQEITGVEWYEYWFSEPYIGHGFKRYGAGSLFDNVQAKFGAYYFGVEYATGDVSSVTGLDLTDFGDGVIGSGGLDLIIGGWIMSDDVDDGAIGFKLSGDNYRDFQKNTFENRDSNFSEEWSSGWDAIAMLTGSSRDQGTWVWVSDTAELDPAGGDEVGFLYLLADRDGRTDNDILMDGLVVSLSGIEVDLDFGNLYANRNSTAKEYNEEQAQILTLQSSSKLNWILRLPSGIGENEIVVSRGGTTINRAGLELKGTAEGSQDITFKVNPPVGSGSSYSKRITLSTYTPLGESNSSWTPSDVNKIADYTIELKARMYGTPTVSVAGASRDSDGREEVNAGSNGRINLAVDETLWFEAESGEPLHPGAVGETKTYQWTDVAGEWRGKPKRSDTRKDFRWSSAGEYTLYCRMVDGNDVATEPNSILVRVWNRPTVESAPPREEIDAGRVSWYGGKFAGWVGEPVKLGASARTNNGSSGEEIVGYLWDPDAGGPEGTLQGGGESISLSADEIEIGRTEIDIGQLGIGRGDYTLEAVIRLDDNLSNSTRAGIILGNYPEQGRTGWEIYSGGKLRLYWNSGNPDAKNLGPDLRDGREHHVAFVRNAESHSRGRWKRTRRSRDFPENGRAGEDGRLRIAGFQRWGSPV